MIVRACSGHLRAKLGNTGATFEFLLPISGQGGEKNRESNHTPAGGESRRILILEDEVDTRLVVKHALESHGFEIYGAETGREATNWNSV